MTHEAFPNASKKNLYFSIRLFSEIHVNRPAVKSLSPASSTKTLPQSVEPPDKKMAEMSLQEKPPVHKAGTSGKQ
jgi:hypothetical protein